jgi:hypothetical protein
MCVNDKLPNVAGIWGFFKALVFKEKFRFPPIVTKILAISLSSVFQIYIFSNVNMVISVIFDTVVSKLGLHKYVIYFHVYLHVVLYPCEICDALCMHVLQLKVLLSKQGGNSSLAAICHFKNLDGLLLPRELPGTYVETPMTGLNSQGNRASSIFMCISWQEVSISL